jgi:hypothetical protein
MSPDAVYPMAIDVRVKSDILSFEKSVRLEIREFLIRLATAPFSPETVKDYFVLATNFFCHKLPCGCLIFWEVFYDPPPAEISIGKLHGLRIRIVGVRFP